MKFNFKALHSLQERYEESSRILKKYPERIPIICERSTSSTSDCPEIDKNKFLVNIDLTVGQFIYVIRRRIVIPQDKALFILVNGFIPCSSQYLSDIYSYHKDMDGFLYITYSYENTFG